MKAGSTPQPALPPPRSAGAAYGWQGGSVARVQTRPAPAFAGRALSRLPRRWGDGLAVLVLLVVPVLRYVRTGADLVVPGDDSDQNLPLRVLVGDQLRHGIIPLLDPFDWSGSPLLGGWNSGAAYPATWLFGFLPAAPAWILGELLTYWVAGLGLYAFLRAQPLRPLAAGLGAVSFTVGGAFAIQVEHFGLVAGVSWVPLALLAIFKLSTSDRPLRWVVLLGVCGGLCVLSGEPRAVAIAAVVLGWYVLWRVIRQPGGRLRLLGLVACGAILAGLLGAVQWAPGMEVVAGSQRDGGGYRLYGAGSMSWSQLLLIFEPVLLGGAGDKGAPGFLGSYSLTEIASYVGILPLLAAGALIGRRWRRPFPEWVGWVPLGVLGILLALGSTTPLGHVFAAIPFYGGQRLQSRNIMITGLALSALFAYWVQEWLERPRRRAGAFVPLAVAAGFGIAALADGPALLRAVAVAADAPDGIGALNAVFAIFLALAVASAALLVLGPRIPPRVRAVALIAVVAVDLTVYTRSVVDMHGSGPSGAAHASVQTPGTSVGTEPLAFPASRIGRDGRFLLYGPDGIGSRSVGGVGDPDLNVYSQRYSVQGYTAAVDALYAATTGTHGILAGGQHAASLWALESGVLDQLSAKYLITQPNRLLSIAGTDKAAQRKLPRTVDAGGTQVWNFGQVLRLSRVAVPVTTDSQRVRLGVRDAHGRVHWLRSRNLRGLLSGAVPARVDATAVLLRSADATVTVGPPRLSLRDGRKFVADGVLQEVLDTGGWVFAGNLDGYGVFVNPHASPPLTATHGTVRRRSGDPLLPESAAVSSPHGTRVVRAVAAIPGWSASWKPDSRPARELSVHRDGLVQAVDVPAGSGVLRWHYSTPGFELGAALTLLGVALIAGAGGWALVRRRR